MKLHGIDPWLASSLPGATRRTIVVADLVESVRIMQNHEVEVIARWRHFVAAAREACITPFGGRLVKSLGDGLLLEYGDPLEALRAVQQLHAVLRSVNQQHGSGPALCIRCGVHVGDVFVDQLDVFGSNVNLAARLAGLAQPEGTVVSIEVRDAAATCADFEFADLGLCFVKHVDQPLRAFAVVDAVLPPLSTAPPKSAGPGLNATVAVVPFAGDGLDPGQRALGDAFADDLIAALVRSPSLRVLSRLSTARLRDADVGLADELRVRLGADYAVLGRMRQRGNTLVVSAQLVALHSQEVTWADEFSTSAAALFAGDDPAVPAIAAAIAAAVRASEVARTRQLPIPNLASFTLYLGGVTLLHRLSRHEFERAHGVLLQLSERVPRSAPPHAMLAKWHIFRMVQGWSDNRLHEGAAARDAARRAIERDPQDAFSLAVDGLTSSIVDGDLEAAEERYRLALQANDNEPYAWALTSSMHSYRDRPAQALAAAERAIALSPLDPTLFLLEAHHALALLISGLAPDAVSAAQRSLQLNAMHTPSHRLLIIGLVLCGRLDEARQAAVRHAALEPEFSVAVYRQRYPGRDAAHAADHARALLEAGVPH